MWIKINDNHRHSFKFMPTFLQIKMISALSIYFTIRSHTVTIKFIYILYIESFIHIHISIIFVRFYRDISSITMIYAKRQNPILFLFFFSFIKYRDRKFLLSFAQQSRGVHVNRIEDSERTIARQEITVPRSDV